MRFIFHTYLDLCKRAHLCACTSGRPPNPPPGIPRGHAHQEPGIPQPSSRRSQPRVSLLTAQPASRLCTLCTGPPFRGSRCHECASSRLEWWQGELISGWGAWGQLGQMGQCPNTPSKAPHGVGSTLGVVRLWAGAKMLNHKKVKNSKLKLAPRVIVKVNVGH